MEKNKPNQLLLNIQMFGLEKGQYPGTCPVDQGMLSKQKGSGSWAQLTGALCSPWSHSPASKPATLSLGRVKSGLKTTDLKPLLLEVSFRKEA